MEVLIVATKNCNHRPILEKQLQEIGVSFQVVYFDDNPDLIQKYGIHHSPNLIVNGSAVFKASPKKSLPTQADLMQIIQKENF